MTNLVQTLLVPIVVVIGLIVLIALGHVTAEVGIPIIAGLAGVHIGANVGASVSSGGQEPVKGTATTTQTTTVDKSAVV